MKETYSCYEYDITKVIVMPDSGAQFGYVYKIYGGGCPPYDDGVIESYEWYDTEAEARFAVVGHITQLENGPDEPDYDHTAETIDWNARRELGE
jgi:hypothetical protein